MSRSFRDLNKRISASVTPRPGLASRQPAEFSQKALILGVQISTATDERRLFRELLGQMPDHHRPVATARQEIAKAGGDERERILQSCGEYGDFQRCNAQTRPGNILEMPLTDDEPPFTPRQTAHGYDAVTQSPVPTDARQPPASPSASPSHTMSWQAQRPA